MKVSGQDLEVTLCLHGRQWTFSEKELVAILEKYFSEEVIERKVAEKVVDVPQEDRWFEVDPKAINQELFKDERKDRKQEETRQLILEAFEELKKSPEKYCKKFRTMMPKKTWQSAVVANLKYMAKQLGDHNADWVEQALEWAQRIHNGESWEAICNDLDTANWYRVVVWKNGYARIIGGCCEDNDKRSASTVYSFQYESSKEIQCAVPLVVRYEM